MKSALTVVLFRLFTIGVFVDGKEASIVSVMEGDSVTLKSGVTDVKTVDDIEWRFNGKRIDKFVDTLQLDSQTGDLKISNIRTKDSGLYKVQISSTTGSPEMEFSVEVESADEETSVSVMEGESVPLRTDPTYIQRDDVIRWRFGQQKSLVAEINIRAGIFNTYDGPDGRFRDRLTLNNQTGSLIITNTRTTDAGLYEAEISSTRSRYTIHHTESFNVTVRDEVESVSVLVGDSVTLRTGLTEIQRDDEILWKFGDQDKLIARLNGPVNKKWSNIHLNNQTGDLNISNITSVQYGYYKVEIKTRRMVLHMKYRITGVFGDKDEVMSAMKGHRVTLNSGVTKKPGDVFLWYFEETLIALVNRHPDTSCLYYGKDEIFKDRLEVDYKTGSLIITNITSEHTGRYEAEFIKRDNTGKTETIIMSSKCERTKINPKRSDLVIQKSFNLTVSGSGLQSGSGVQSGSGLQSGSGVQSAVPDASLSRGVVAGIVAVVLLLAAAVAVLVGFVIYYRRKNSEPERQRVENGGNRNTQKTDDHATEETKLDDS